MLKVWLPRLLLAFMVLVIPLVWTLTPLGAMLIDVLDAVRAMGPLGQLLYAALMIPAAALVVPAYLTMGGAGVLFGPWAGFAVAFCGATASSLTNFLLGRTVLRRVVLRAFGRGALFRGLDARLAGGDVWLVALLRASPFWPYNLISFALGTTSLRPGPALVGTLIGGVPTVGFFVAVGASLGELARLSEGGEAPGPLWWAALAVTVLSVLAITWVVRGTLRDLTRTDQASPPVDAAGPADG